MKERARYSKKLTSRIWFDFFKSQFSWHYASSRFDANICRRIGGLEFSARKYKRHDTLSDCVQTFFSRTKENVKAPSIGWLILHHRITRDAISASRVIQWYGLIQETLYCAPDHVTFINYAYYIPFSDIALIL